MEGQEQVSGGAAPTSSPRSYGRTDGYNDRWTDKSVQQAHDARAGGLLDHGKGGIESAYGSGADTLVEPEGGRVDPGVLYATQESELPDRAPADAYGEYGRTVDEDGESSASGFGLGPWSWVAVGATALAGVALGAYIWQRKAGGWGQLPGAGYLPGVRSHGQSRSMDAGI